MWFFFEFLLEIFSLIVKVKKIFIINIFFVQHLWFLFYFFLIYSFHFEYLDYFLYAILTLLYGVFVTIVIDRIQIEKANKDNTSNIPKFKLNKNTLNKRVKYKELTNISIIFPQEDSEVNVKAVFSLRPTVIIINGIEMYSDKFSIFETIFYKVVFKKKVIDFFDKERTFTIKIKGLIIPCIEISVS